MFRSFFFFFLVESARDIDILMWARESLIGMLLQVLPKAGLLFYYYFFNLYHLAFIRDLFYEN